MGLFPHEPGSQAVLSGAPRRMAWTRESGTRKLLLLLTVIAVLWYGIGKWQDSNLLKTRWPALAPDPQGLNVVGTLNARDSYDRNLFKVVTANKSSPRRIDGVRLEHHF